MKWKIVVVIIIGLLIVSLGLKFVIVKFFFFKLYFIGVYDLYLIFNDDLKDVVLVLVYFYIDICGGIGSFEGKLFIRYEVI